MALRLHNTLTNRVDPLVPLEGETVRFYTCGPTVYTFAHIGNFRTFLSQDLLRRYLRYRGFKLRHVMNITDVDDNIIRAALAEGLAIEEYTARYTEAFLKDMETLGIERPEVMPRATEHIEEMVELIIRLRERGHTYEREGSTYFRIASFPEYGRLSRLDPASLTSSGRVDTDKYSKENPRDFVLWKARRPGEPFWETPLGPGRPGWHIECSAMSMKYLGESFDIHFGGVDLVFPHHENEIAQSRCGTGQAFVERWMHGEFLLVEGEKMSKSLGNQYTLRELLERGHDPLAIRYLLQSAHYRKRLNFTFEGLQQCRSALDRARDLAGRLRQLPSGIPDDPRMLERIEAARRGFESGMDEDLNTPAALGALFELVREANIALEKGRLGSAGRDAILSLLADANQVLAVFDLEEVRLEDEEILALIREREEARSRRDYRRADEIRDQLVGRGILLEDTREGTRWKRVS